MIGRRAGFRYAWIAVIGALGLSAQDPCLLAQEATPQYKGGATCTFCHSRSLADNVRPFYRDLVLLNEGAVVRDQDKHALAYKVLEGPLAQQMGERLGWKVTEDGRCLSCHANRRADVPRGADFAQVVNEGVGCEACHGPGSLYEVLHQQPSWRSKTPDEKARLGMVDVRNPAERVRQCASCHIGDVAQGKVITHEMYAAGHPPLPPFEVAAYAEQMPRHWRYLCEKGALQHEAEFLQANGYGSSQAARQQLPVLREVLIGDVVAATVALRLEGRWAETSQQGTLDLATFDCQACHHDLRYPSWRQQRGYGGAVPGRPIPPGAALAVLPAVIRSLEISDEQRERWNQTLERMRKQRHDAFSQLPFGNRQQVGQATQDMAQWLESEVLPLLGQATYDAPQARRTLNALVQEAETTSDYASARVLLWAAWAIAGELAVDYPAAFRAPLALPGDETARQAQVETDVRLWQEWQVASQARRAQFRQATFAETGLETALALQLPAGQTVALTDKLPELLSAMGKYHPEETQVKTTQLRQLLEKMLQEAQP